MILEIKYENSKSDTIFVYHFSILKSPHADNYDLSMFCLWNINICPEIGRNILK